MTGCIPTSSSSCRGDRWTPQHCRWQHWQARTSSAPPLTPPPRRPLSTSQAPVPVQTATHPIPFHPIPSSPSHPAFTTTALVECLQRWWRRGVRHRRLPTSQSTEAAVASTRQSFSLSTLQIVAVWPHNRSRTGRSVGSSGHCMVAHAQQSSAGRATGLAWTKTKRRKRMRKKKMRTGRKRRTKPDEEAVTTYHGIVGSGFFLAQQCPTLSARCL